MKSSIHTKLVLGLLPGLFFLLLIGSVGYISLSCALRTVDTLLTQSANSSVSHLDVLPQSRFQQTHFEVGEIQRTAGRVIVFSTLAAVAGGAIFAFFFARSLSRPIVALNQGVRRIGEGDFNQRLNIQANDEIGQLAQAYNDMAGRLRESYALLERRVVERTRELALLHAEEHRQRQLADTLRQVSRSLAASLNLDEVLTNILQLMGQVLHVDAGLILLLELDQLKVAAVRGRPELAMDRWLGYIFEPQASPGFHQVLEQKRPLTFCEPDRANLFERGIDRIEAVQWCLVVPLLRGQEVIGLLALEQLGHCYDQVEETQLAFTFADHAVLAIENARLFTEVQQLNSELEARVQQRTAELTEARDALDKQAQQLRELFNLTVEIQEAERDRIAHEIHDGITQWTLGALYELEAARVCWHNRPEAALEKVAGVQEMLKRIKTELYQVIHNLHPPLLQPDGLLAALKTYAAEYQQLNGVLCQVEVEGIPRRLAAGQELAIYRIVQEALSNARTHGQATRVRLVVTFAPAQVTIQVADNGQGFDQAQPFQNGRTHLGLIGMQERAQNIGGRLAVRSIPGTGTTVQIQVPGNSQPRNEV